MVRWFVAWVIACVPAGALAGVGWLEFYVLSPVPPDGGFAGDLILFGGFLAFGQAPFIAIFTWFLLRRAGAGSRRRYSAAVTSAFGWTLAGALGWTLGSMIIVFIPVSYSPVDPPVAYVLSLATRWLVMGFAEGLVLGTVCLLVVGTAVSAGSRVGLGVARASALFAGMCLAWAATSAVGGFLFETARAGTYSFSQRVGQSLRGPDVAANITEVVIPYALLIPVLYGLITGFALVVARRVA